MKGKLMKAVIHVAWLVCRWKFGGTDGAWWIEPNKRVFWPARLLLKDDGQVSKMVMFQYRECEFRWMLMGRRHCLMWRTA